MCHFIDCCNHGKETYAGSFSHKNKNYDVYLYLKQFPKHGKTICIRYGNDNGDYISPYMPGFHNNNSPIYQKALAMAVSKDPSFAEKMTWLHKLRMVELADVSHKYKLQLIEWALKEESLFKHRHALFVLWLSEYLFGEGQIIPLKGIFAEMSEGKGFVEKCRFCGCPLKVLNGDYLDSSDGDCCSGSDYLENEGGIHEPE